MARIWYTNSVLMDYRDSMNQNLISNTSLERLLNNLLNSMIYFVISSMVLFQMKIFQKTRFSKMGKQWLEYGIPIKTSKYMKNK